MGGQWDATNVVDADVSVIMPIGLDHMEYLGNTIGEIAKTKAGIIKEQGFVVLAQQEPEAAVELLRRAAEVGADVAREGLEYSIDSRAIAVGGQLISITGLRGHYDEIFLPLHGKHQASNAAAALIAVEAFFGEQDLDIDAVRAGFANVTSPGRCEIIHRDPIIILDAAHNPHGAKAIAETIQSEFTFDDVTGIVALMADNSAARSMSVNDLEALATQVFGADRVFAQPTLADAIDKAIKDSVRPLSDESLAILITGSVVTVGQARTAVRKRYAKATIEDGK
jgi:dihydrofolate synthase/folylpolyglutamate synthase